MTKLELFFEKKLTVITNNLKNLRFFKGFFDAYKAETGTDTPKPILSHDVLIEENIKQEIIDKTDFKQAFGQLNAIFKNQSEKNELLILNAALRAFDASIAFDAEEHCKNNLPNIFEKVQPIINKLYTVTHLTKDTNFPNHEFLEITCNKKYESVTGDTIKDITTLKVLELMLLSNYLILRRLQKKDMTTVIVLLEVFVFNPTNKTFELKQIPLTHNVDFWACLDIPETISLLNQEFLFFLKKPVESALSPYRDLSHFKALKITFVKKTPPKRSQIKNLKLDAKGYKHILYTENPGGYYNLS